MCWIIDKSWIIFHKVRLNSSFRGAFQRSSHLFSMVAVIISCYSCIGTYLSFGDLINQSQNKIMIYENFNYSFHYLEQFQCCYS